MTGRTRSVGLMMAVATLVSACAGGDGDSDWTGTVTDSAGVEIVANPAQGVWTADEVPAVTEELKIGTAGGDPNYQFGAIAAVDVGSDGSVFVLDQQAQQVRVFDGEGDYLRTIGGPGGGPGELSQALVALVVTEGDTVFVVDMGHQRITRYTAAGETVGSFPVPLAQGIPIRWQIGPDGRIVQQTRIMAMPGQAAATAPADPRDLLLERDASGAITDTVMQLPIGESFQFSENDMRIRLFEAEPMWALGSGGAVYFGLNSGFDIGQYGPDGELVRRIRRPAERKPVTEADIVAIRKAMEELFRQQAVGAPPEAIQMLLSRLEFADHYPAFANMIGGPGGSLWAQRVTSAQDMADAGVTDFNPQDIGSPVWDVFGTDGRYMGEVRLPDRFQPLRVIDNRIWGVWRDDLDVQYVTMLRIDMESMPIPTEGRTDG